jgi:hypothetical protein
LTRVTELPGVQLEKPGIGRAIAGVAAAALATGPTVILWLQILDMLLGESGAPLFGMLGLMVLASLFGLIGSLPAACVNAFILGLAARHDKDEAWLSAVSGALIAMLVAVVMGGLGVETMGTAFVLTGILMGLLHWAIAIRPRRRWRLSLLRDEEAIRAME